MNIVNYDYMKYFKTVIISTVTKLRLEKEINF